MNPTQAERKTMLPFNRVHYLQKKGDRLFRLKCVIYFWANGKQSSKNFGYHFPVRCDE